MTALEIASLLNRRIRGRTYGGISLLAAELGVSRMTIYNWQRIPAEYVLHVEELTGLDREIIRPDIFGPKTKKVRQKFPLSVDNG